VSGLERIVVVGASVAGVNAARTLRSEGFGGELVVVDAQAREPYDRPPLSKQVLRGEWDAERAVLVAARDLDVTWRLGQAATGLHVTRRMLSLADGDELEADGLILATGARARTLPGTDGIADVHVLRTLDDALAIRSRLEGAPKRVVVVGAGFIGCEVAASARATGHEVTIVEPLEQPLARVLGNDLGAVVAALHRSHGVTLELGVGVDAVDESAGVTRVHLDDDRVLDADLVVVGIGVEPDTEWLVDSGLELADGIVADASLLAAPGIAVAGDVLRWPSLRSGRLERIEHWEHAVVSGEAAARRLLAEDGPGADFDPVPWFWSDQYDAKLQLAGRAGPGLQRAVVDGSLDEGTFVMMLGDGSRCVGVVGIGRPGRVVRLRRHVVERTPWDEALAAASS
jgi:NADPH-dependent 2,4-dienoyl-CoA reductase/sulfur reductase-like enzyme